VTIAVLIVIALVIVVVGGLLFYRVAHKAQTEVPRTTDARAAWQPQVVGTDEKGAPILDTDEPVGPPRDEGAFESLLQDEIHDRGMKPPPDPQA
jgi:hypothetical protein